MFHKNAQLLFAMIEIILAFNLPILPEMLSAGGPLDAQGGNSKFTARLSPIFKDVVLQFCFSREISFIRDGLTYEGWRLSYIN